MRLIDADATPSMGISNFSVMFRKVIDDMPTVDLWKYPAKGELPKKDGEYLITVKIEGGGYINAFAIYVVDRGWLGIFNKPYAWQLIEPPKEEA